MSAPKDTAWQAAAAAAVAEAFELGAPAGGLRPVSGAGAHLMWRLETTRGEWAVKSLNRSREAWWMRDFQLATTIEAQAYARGVAMPRPLAPPLLDLPVLGEQTSFQVHEWSPGARLRPGLIGAAVREWVGTTLAALHRAPVPGPITPEMYEPEDPQEWEKWLTAAGDTSGLVAQVRSRLGDVAQAKAVVDRARDRFAAELTPVLTHRDIRPDNVLIEEAGPVLLDWDGAGPEYAEWEVLRTALTFSTSEVEGLDHSAFRQVVACYRRAGGFPVPPTEAVLAGWLRQQLGAAQWLLWRALGHRPLTPQERAASATRTVDALDELRRGLRDREVWSALLRDLPIS